MILLDTHTLVWWQAGGKLLSKRARNAIAAADRVLVSPVSLWEVTMLSVKKRILLDRDPYIWCRDLFDDDQVELAPLSAQAAVHAGLLPDSGFKGDPADAMIYATAHEKLVPLVCKDSKISTYAESAHEVEIIW